MRIEGWQIDGFGTFHDFHVTHLPRGLVVVHGPNEAGKTTLLAFLRGVLFGFADRRSPESLYPPLRGGRHGGALLIEAGGGTWRVERTAGRRVPPIVVRPDGSEGDAGDLQRLLGGADETLFKSVFAFSLEELTAMQSLSSEEVRAHIFSAGIAGAGRSARKVIEELDREASVLLKPRAGAIRELIRKAADLKASIRAATSAAADYPALVGEEETSRGQVHSLRDAITTAQVRADRASKLIELWPIESDLQRAREELTQLPDVADFHADAEERLIAITTRIDAERRAVEAQAANVQELQAQCSQIHVDDRIAAIAGDVQALADELSTERDRIQQIASARQSRDALRNEASRAIEALGPSWTEQDVEALDITLPGVEEVRGWQAALQSSNEASQAAAGELQLFENGCSAVDCDLQQLREDIARSATNASADGLEAIIQRVDTVAASAAKLAGVDPASLVSGKAAADALLRLREAERDEDRVRQLVTAATVQLAGIEVDHSLDAVHAAIADVSRTVDAQRKRLADIEQIARTAADEQAAVEKGVRGLGPGWTADAAMSLGSDFDQVRGAREFDDRLAAAHRATEQAARDVEIVRRGISGREKDLARVQERTAAEPLAADELSRRAACVRRLRTRLADLVQVDARVQAAQQIEKERARLAGARTAGGSQSPGWLTPVLVMVAVLSAAAGAWRLLAEHDIVTALVLLAIALGLGIAAAATQHAAGRAMASRVNRDTTADVDGTANLEALRERESALRSQIAADAAALGLAPMPPVADIEECDDVLQRERQARARHDEAAAEARRLQEEIESWQTSFKDRLQTQADCEGDERQVFAEWDAWKRDNGLPAALTPNAARDFLHEVRSVQDHIRALRSANAALESLQAAVAAWEYSARRVLALRTGETSPPLERHHLVDAVSELQRVCAEDGQRRRDEARVAAEKQRRERELDDASRRLTDARATAVPLIHTAVERVAQAWERTQPVRTRRCELLQQEAARVERVREEWQDWQIDRGVVRRAGDATSSSSAPARFLSPDGVLDFFALVRTAREIVRRRDEVEAQLGALESASRQWSERTQAVASAAGVATAASIKADTWLEVVRELVRRCHTDAEARRTDAALHAEIRKAANALSQLRGRLQDAEQQLADLLREADCANAAEFRGKLAVFRARAALQQRLRDLDARIVAVLGRDSGAATLRAELSSGRVSEWEAGLAACSKEVRELQQAYEDSIRAHQDVTTRKSHVERAADIASLEIEHQGVLSELASAVERWRTLRLARGLVADTLADFERTRQPEVLAAASQYFCRVTSGRYARILQDEEGQDVAIIDRLGARRRSTDLSRGTREQLYLSIRLGLAREFSQHAEPLPLVMDDVLVNFDPGRARQMALELMAFGEQSQVLLFTCHPFTRDVFLEIDGNVPVIELPLPEIPESVSIGSQSAG